MSIRTVVTRGFGNGTFVGTIADVALRGYSIGEDVTPTQGCACMGFAAASAVLAFSSASAVQAFSSDKAEIGFNPCPPCP